MSTGHFLSTTSYEHRNRQFQNAGSHEGRAEKVSLAEQGFLKSRWKKSTATGSEVGQQGRTEKRKCLWPNLS